MTASDLYAILHSTSNSGNDQCHWCGDLCERIWPHDEAPQFPFQHNRSHAKRPGNGYVCQGCFLYRRQRVTVSFLTGGFRDGQTAADHSWWLTEKGAHALQTEDFPRVYDLLLKPPLRFVLSLKTVKGPRNELHLSQLNDHGLIRAETDLLFTLDNVPFTYTIYELDNALKHGGNGRYPGVQALLRFLGKPPPHLLPSTKPNQRGRPNNPVDGKGPQRLIQTSGPVPKV